MKYIKLISLALLLLGNSLVSERVMADVLKCDKQQYPNTCWGCQYDPTTNFVSCGAGPTPNLKEGKVVERDKCNMMPCIISGASINCGAYRWCQSSSGFTAGCDMTGWCDQQTGPVCQWSLADLAKVQGNWRDNPDGTKTDKYTLNPSQCLLNVTYNDGSTRSVMTSKLILPKGIQLLGTPSIIKSDSQIWKDKGGRLGLNNTHGLGIVP